MQWAWPLRYAGCIKMLVAPLVLPFHYADIIYNAKLDFFSQAIVQTFEF